MNTRSEEVLNKKDNSAEEKSIKSNILIKEKSIHDKGEDMDFIIENEIDGLLMDNVSFLTETNPENGNNGNNKKLVYFAIEKKWVMVGPGVFRK